MWKNTRSHEVFLQNISREEIFLLNAECGMRNVECGRMDWELVVDGLPIGNELSLMPMLNSPMWRTIFCRESSVNM